MSTTGLNRTAMFKISGEGFSIHTFELSSQYSALSWHGIKKELYDKQEAQKGTKKIWIYKESHGRHICTKFSEHGVRITLEHNECKNEYDTYFIRIVINPRRLLDPNSSYLGILQPTKKSAKRIKDAFYDLLFQSPFEEVMDVYLLTRIDLCANVYCNHSKIFQEFIRVSRRLPTPPKFERTWYTDKDQDKARRYNKHYIRYTSKSFEMVLYDKTYQMQENKLALSYEKLPEGVLRYELRLSRGPIRMWAKKQDIESCSDLLASFISNSETMLKAHYKNCYPEAEFYRLPELIEKVNSLSIHANSKDLMITLVEKIHQGATTDQALCEMEAAGANPKTLLKCFSEAYLCPVPLRKNFCAKKLPNPTYLLYCTSENPVPIAYIRSK